MKDDKEIFSEMLLLTGYMELINDFKHVEKYIIRQKTKLRMEISNDAKNPTNLTSQDPRFKSKMTKNTLLSKIKG